MTDFASSLNWRSIAFELVFTGMETEIMPQQAKTMFFEQLKDNPELARELFFAQSENRVQEVIRETGADIDIADIRNVLDGLACTIAMKLAEEEDAWFDRHEINPNVKQFLRKALNDEQHAQQLLQIESTEDLQELIAETGFCLQTEDVSKSFGLYLVDKHTNPENFELREEDLDNITGGGAMFAGLGAMTGGTIGGIVGIPAGTATGMALGAAAGATVSAFNGDDIQKSADKWSKRGGYIGGIGGGVIGIGGGALIGGGLGALAPEP